jgi:hypothetical protein
MSTPDPTSPIRLFAITHAFDEQVSIFEELLGDPAALIAAAEQKHEVVLAPPDPATLIHPERGADRIHLGQTMDEVKAALGEAPDLTDFTELFDGQSLGLSDVDWYYEALGVQVSFVKERVRGLSFHSGTYRGGLIPRSWGRWEGGLAPDMTWESVSEEDLEARFGAPTNAYDCDVELSEIMDEEPVRRVVYPGWTFEFLLDGRLQAVLLEVPKPPPEPPSQDELDQLLAELEQATQDSSSAGDEAPEADQPEGDA